TVTAGPLVSYNILATTALALNTTFAFIAFRRWSAAMPSLVGAAVFGFSPYVIAASIGHLAQVMLMSAPLMLILLDRLLVVQAGKPWRDGLFLGLLAWAQLLTGEEVLAMEAVTAAVLVIVLCAFNNRSVVIPHLRYAAKGLPAMVGAFVLPAAPFLAYQYAGPGRVQDVHPPNVYVSDLLNFVVPTNITQFAPQAARHLSAHFTGNGSEQGAYIGIPLLVLLALCLIVARRRKLVWVALSVAAVTALLSMGPTVHVAGHISTFPLPDKYLQRLPFFHNLLPSRFSSMMFLALGAVLAVGLHEMPRTSWTLFVGMGRATAAGPPSLRRVRISLATAAWGLALLGLAAIAPVVNFLDTQSPPVAAFTTRWVCSQQVGNPDPHARAHAPRVNALVLPGIDEMALRWQSEAGFCYSTPTDTGMTGSAYGLIPVLPVLLAAGTPGLALPPITATVRSEAAGEISTMGVGEIMVAPWFPSIPIMTSTGQSQLVAWLTSLLRQQPEVNGDTYIWTHLPSASAIETP
ncbi:MAG TPA: hypothetical protein VED59_09160, partial [Acidimicrobiales bacterium]|nr:hypothetical protein [Acidimicrobiales bacterium]